MVRFKTLLKQRSPFKALMGICSVNAVTFTVTGSAACRPGHTSKVARVYSALSSRVNGAFLFSPAFFSAAVSVCLTIPTCSRDTSSQTVLDDGRAAQLLCSV